MGVADRSDMQRPEGYGRRGSTKNRAADTPNRKGEAVMTNEMGKKGPKIMNWREELAREARELEREANEKHPSSEADDQAFDERVFALLAAAGEEVVLSDATAEALDELFAPRELPVDLRARLRTTMARAQAEREVMEVAPLGEWSLSRYIRAKREALGMTIDNLAKELDLHPKVLGGLEAGNVAPDQVGVRPLLRLAEIVKAPLLEFVQVVKRSALGTVTASAATEVSGLPRAETRMRRRERRDLVSAAPAALAQARRDQMRKFLQELEAEARRRTDR